MDKKTVILAEIERQNLKENFPETYYQISHPRRGIMRDDFNENYLENLYELLLKTFNESLQKNSLGTMTLAELKLAVEIVYINRWVVELQKLPTIEQIF